MRLMHLDLSSAINYRALTGLKATLPMVLDLGLDEDAVVITCTQRPGLLSTDWPQGRLTHGSGFGPLMKML